MLKRSLRLTMDLTLWRVPTTSVNTMRFLPVISSHHNEWFKSIQRLHQSTERRDRNRFLIEGTHLVEEAIATNWPLESICFEEGWAKQNQPLLDRIAADPNRSNVLLQPATTDILRRLSTTSSRCSVVGVAVDQDAAKSDVDPISLALAVESLQDPGNLGSMIRIAAAAGVNHVFLSDDCVSPTNPKVLRSSAGQWFRSPPLVIALPAFLKRQADSSVQILAAGVNGKSFWETELTGPTLFLLGNEGNGLSSEIRSLATGEISVPMSLGVESLNVSITAALLIYEAQRQRRCKDGFRAHV